MLDFIVCFLCLSTEQFIDKNDLEFFMPLKEPNKNCVLTSINWRIK